MAKDLTYEEIRKHCPCSRALHMLGKRWTLEILAELICQGDKKRYNQIQRALVTITPKVLSQRLKEMEQNDLIKRKVYAEETPVRVEYQITDKGRDLKKVVDALTSWGKKWMADDPAHDYCSLCQKFRAVHADQFKSGA